MTSKKIILCIGTLSVFLVFSVSGQNQPSQKQEVSGKEKTIEELYLSQNIELQMIRNQAISSDWELKSLALQNLRSMANDKRISDENPGAFLILETLAKQEQGPNIKNFNTVRREACNILGDIGGVKSQKILVEVLMADQEPMVLAEAVYALGKIGNDKDGEIFNRIMWILHKENAKTLPDNNFAFATLLTIEKIGKSSEGIKRPETLNILIEMIESNYIRDVKLKAADVISKLLRK